MKLFLHEGKPEPHITLKICNMQRENLKIKLHNTALSACENYSMWWARFITLANDIAEVITLKAYPEIALTYSVVCIINNISELY